MLYALFGTLPADVRSSYESDRGVGHPGSATHTHMTIEAAAKRVPNIRQAFEGTFRKYLRGRSETHPGERPCLIAMHT